ncbi:hypothetical protein HYPSUDRAFT_202098 [Hypholoma sublateritium FD-334 SS-4]|uniref:Uncharacterized protein n=1 Tax=Hypholoma sublateritium (strain FD-334 SS-4) TaxID=945553 RepID=A0A0D2MFZ0_HYPSF|nr:hypothetical protein HYPSUDRAFT_202098 [Hypholoma sublateritium FD-334 SS-4]
MSAELEFSGINIDITYTLSIFVETLIHGIYTSLFLSALPVMFKSRSQRVSRRMSTNWVFPIATVLMYTVSSLHVVLSLYRFLRAYIVEPGIGWLYFWQFTRWDSFANSIVVCIMTWLGDALVIYRCYCVWNNNLPLVIVPLLLLGGSIGVNIYTLIWFSHPLDFGKKSEIMSLNAIYPLSLAQNVITTGLITLKLWSQHRQSSASGVIDRSSRLSLIKIIRIIIESAMVYTIQLCILIVLYFLNDTFQYIVQAAIVPSIGIVFVLIALRVHRAKQQDADIGSSLGVIPTAWLTDRDSTMETSQQDSASMDDQSFPKPVAKSESMEIQQARVTFEH